MHAALDIDLDTIESGFELPKPEHYSATRKNTAGTVKEKVLAFILSKWVDINFAIETEIILFLFFFKIVIALASARFVTLQPHLFISDIMSSH